MLEFNKVKKKPKYFLLFLVVVICVAKSLKFGSPFLTLFLVEEKKISEYEVNNYIYPIWTYTDAVARIFFVFLITTIPPEAVAFIYVTAQFLAYAILVFVKGGMPYTLLWMMITQVTYGISTASSGGILGCISCFLEPAAAAKWHAHLKTIAVACHSLSSVAGGYMIATFNILLPFIATFFCLAIALIAAFILWMLTWKTPLSQAQLVADPRHIKDRELFLPNLQVLLICAAWIFIYSVYVLCEGYYSSLIYKFAELGTIDIRNSGYIDALGRIASFCGALLLSCTNWWHQKHQVSYIYCIMAASLMGYFIIALSAMEAEHNIDVKVAIFWAMLMSLGVTVTTILTCISIKLLNSSGRMVSFFISVKTAVCMLVTSIITFILDGKSIATRFCIIGWIAIVAPTVFLAIAFAQVSYAQEPRN